MFNFIFKSATYYILWKKFKKQIVTVLISISMVLIINSIYSDLYEVLKVNTKESLIYLFTVKWLLISIIVFFNIYKLLKTEIIEENEVRTFDFEIKNSSNLYKNLNVHRSTTDILLSKYEKKNNNE